MTTDPLGRVLSEADAVGGDVIAASPHALAGQVRAEFRRRIVRRRLIGCVATVALFGAAILIPLAWRERAAPSQMAVVIPQPQMSPGEVARVRREIATLAARANAGEMAVAAMIRVEQRAARRGSAPAPVDPIHRIRDQQDLAALALVRQADRLYRELDHKQTATTTYERVLVLFPQTPSATVARRRLTEMKG